MSQNSKVNLNYDPFQYIEDARRFTPDFIKFNDSPYDEFPVLVTGSLRKNQRNNGRLDGCNYYGAARTYLKRFISKVPNGYAAAAMCEPFVFDTNDFTKKLIQENDIPASYYEEHRTGAVEGDLYGVPLRTLTVLDQFCGNTEGFKRDHVWVSLLHPSQEEASCQAYFYTVDIEFFMNIFDYQVDAMRDDDRYHVKGPYSEYNVYKT
jgi:gamma-glutamylcyclotransferase (GGCT)/AIG2-like uncharacterized protein YtfP